MSRLENLLGAASLTVSDRIADAGRATGTAAPDQAALVTLLAHPGNTVSWLGAVLGLTSSGITRQVDRLVASGWVTRSPGEDARQRTLQLTRSGTARARSVLRARRDAVGAAVAGLDAADRDDLERLLEQLVSGLAQTRGPALRVCRLCDRSACASADRTCPLEHTSTGDTDG